MDIESSKILWEETGMDTAAIDFVRLFPDYKFDSRTVMSLIMQGRLLDAVRELWNGITGVIN